LYRAYDPALLTIASASGLSPSEIARKKRHIDMAESILDWADEDESRQCKQARVSALVDTTAIRKAANDRTFLAEEPHYTTSRAYVEKTGSRWKPERS